MSTPTSVKKTRRKRRATVGKSLSSLAFLRLLDMAGLPRPITEWPFARPRKWRMDYAWPEAKVFLEVQGGIWTEGRHSRGAAMLKEWEKINTASGLGWRVLYCQPTELCARRTIEQISNAINYKP